MNNRYIDTMNTPPLFTGYKDGNKFQLENLHVGTSHTLPIKVDGEREFIFFCRKRYYIDNMKSIDWLLVSKGI